MIEKIENLSAKYIDAYINKEKCLIIDIRGEFEYRKGHILNAINVPFDRIEKNDFNFPKDYELIIYCERGGLSLMAAKHLSKLGYHVINVVGGINAYNGRLY